MADYNKTPQVVAQVAELKKLMSDGRTMSPEDIMSVLNRKWISSVVYYLGEDVNLETVKDGRRVIGYRISDGVPKTSQSKVAATVENATAAAKRATKRPEPTETVADVPQTVVPDIDMRSIMSDYKPQPKAVAVPVKPDVAPRDPDMPLHQWKDKDLVDVNGVNLVMPGFLKRT